METSKRRVGSDHGGDRGVVSRMLIAFQVPMRRAQAEILTRTSVEVPWRLTLTILMALDLRISVRLLINHTAVAFGSTVYKHGDWHSVRNFSDDRRFARVGIPRLLSGSARRVEHRVQAGHGAPYSERSRLVVQAQEREWREVQEMELA